MSIQQIFSRLARIARSETRFGNRGRIDHDDLVHAEALIAAERRREAEEREARLRESAEAKKSAIDLDRALATLGLEPTATFDDVVAAYRREVAQVHPDRVTGDDAGAQRRANVRTLELNRAYTYLKGYFHG